jgi:hypothetical protein
MLMIGALAVSMWVKPAVIAALMAGIVLAAWTANRP